ncbi:MAG: 7-cyano-7-deazaguanine synthase QueC [Vicinamibacterales bacterium]
MTNASEPQAVLLLSGGLDSYTAGALMAERGFALWALSVKYGQVHERELESSRRVARALRVRGHVELPLDLRSIAASALTGVGSVPKERPLDRDEIPATYVPARNTVFLALALAWAETLGLADVVLGVNALDYSGYPDCRPAFLTAFQELARVATKAGVEGTAFTIHAPLIAMTKAQIIREGIRLGLDYGLTLSCYDPNPDGVPCGHCDSCRLRQRGFDEAGVVDPAAGLRS